MACCPRLHDSADSTNPNSQHALCLSVWEYRHSKWTARNQRPICRMSQTNVLSSLTVPACWVWISQPALTGNLLHFIVYSTVWIRMFCSCSKNKNKWHTKSISQGNTTARDKRAFTMSSKRFIGTRSNSFCNRRWRLWCFHVLFAILSFPEKHSQ